MDISQATENSLRQAYGKTHRNTDITTEMNGICCEDETLEKSVKASFHCYRSNSKTELVCLWKNVPSSFQP